jgi:hypothetical protein
VGNVIYDACANVYLIGAVAHLLTWGFQASGVQSVESASKIIEAIDRTRLQVASI